MAQWGALLKLDADSKGRVFRLYHEHKIPIDIRRSLSDWIESQDWVLAAADGSRARTCFQALLLKLEELIKESFYNNHTLQGPDFSLLKDHLINNFEYNPVEMAVRLSKCLEEEKMLLESRSMEEHCSAILSEQTQTDLDNAVNELKSLTEKSGEEIKALKKEVSNYKLWESQVKQLNGLVSLQMQEQCLNQGNFIRTTKQELVDQVQRCVALADLIVQSLVSVELPKWKRGQQMSCIGNPVSTNLDQLEKWFSSVGKTLLQMVPQLKELQPHNTSNMSEVLQQIGTKVTALFIKLLENSLVVEKQPVTSNQPHRPLVLRTKVFFTVKLRFLGNLPFLKDKCLIRAEFDKDVEEVKTIKGFRRFIFTKKCRSTKVLDVDTESGSLVAEFNMEIEDKSSSKRSNQTPIRVNEELHVIKFSTDLRLDGQQIHVETSSLPLVVMSTTTQGASAWASILWYNLLSVAQPTSLSVFLDPPPLSWEQLSQALSWQFISAGDRALNQDQLDELKLKLTDGPDELVFWSKFSNKEGPWFWIDEILDLIEKHLKHLWRDGSIMGFVSKDRARALLQTRPSGTFLLRFSESKRKGAISFSLVGHRNKKACVRDIDPFNKDELSKMSLADHINLFRDKSKSSNPLLYLYPDIPKDQAFGRYYTPSETNKPVAPYVGRRYLCEEDCPSPPSPSPDHTHSDLEDLMDSPSRQLLQAGQFEDCDLFSSVRLYSDDSDSMDVSESF